MPNLPQETARSLRIHGLFDVSDPEACRTLHAAIASLLSGSTTTAVEDVHVLCRVLADIIVRQALPTIRPDLAGDLPLFLGLVIENALQEAAPRHHV